MEGLSQKQGYLPTVQAAEYTHRVKVSFYSDITQHQVLGDKTTKLAHLLHNTYIIYTFNFD